MTKYTKTIDGKVVIKERNRIVINKDGRQTINPSHEMLLEDGWVVYTIPEPTDEELIQRAKRNIKADINHFDSSSDVNEFYINDNPMWLDKATRAGLKLRFEAEMAMGNENTTLWNNGVQYPLPLNTAMQMLYALEIYASACYDNTQAHLANVDNLETIQEIKEYDYRVGYPEKLKF